MKGVREKARSEAPAKDFAGEARAWVSTRGSKHTRAAYERDLRLWLEFATRADVSAESPPPEACAAFREEVSSSRAPLSVRRVLASLSSVFAAVRPQAANPFSERALPRPRASQYAKTEAVPDDVAARLVEAAGSRGENRLRDRALVAVLWATGMRRVSAVSVRRADVFRRDGVLVARYLLKGGAQAEAELAGEAAAAVAAWLAAAPKSKWLFCQAGGSALSPQAVTKIVAEAARAAGVRAHPHQFRSAFITRALDAGIHLERVQRAAGHSDPRSTLGYDRGRRGAGVAAELAAFRAAELEKARGRS